jgi:hypothetical protein
MINVSCAVWFRLFLTVYLTVHTQSFTCLVDDSVGKLNTAEPSCESATRGIHPLSQFVGFAVTLDVAEEKLPPTQEILRLFAELTSIFSCAGPSQFCAVMEAVGADFTVTSFSPVIVLVPLTLAISILYVHATGNLIPVIARVPFALRVYAFLS